MAIKKASHCAYQTHNRIVFSVKHRKALLNEEITTNIKTIATEIGERYEIELEHRGVKVC